MNHTRNIIVDSLILVAFSSLLGGLSLLVSKSFSGDPNPALDLVTVMKKAEAKEVNASSEQEEKEARVKGMKEFEQTLKEGEELAAAEGKAFVNMTDPHGRTPVMWVCYANYNNIETTLKLEATPASGRPPRGNRPKGQGRVDRAALGFLERAGPPVRHAD